MKISPENVVKAIFLVGGILVGTGGTIGAQRASQPAVAPLKPQIIREVVQIKPDCPAIFLDGVKLSK